MNIVTFFKKHLFIANLLLAAIIIGILLSILLVWLNIYTKHGSQVQVPDVKGLSIEEAAPLFQNKSLNYTVIDSMFVKNIAPGNIVETVPPVGTSVKEGRTIYLTVNSTNVKKLSIPDVIDMSQRQGLSMLNSIGFESVTIKTVPGAFRNLIIGLETRGATLKPGDKVVSDAPLTLLVSSGNGEIDLPPAEEDGLDDTEEETWY
jgi:beta-lactam-binding protein with PASTA domain